MEENLLAVKATVAVFATAVASFLGWKGIMAVVWVIAMMLDYISGTAAACKAGEWSSENARQGLWHKGGMILVVLVSAIGDSVLGMCLSEIGLQIEWSGIVLPLVLAWYIITEFGSVLENAYKLGAKVPEWLVKLLKVSAKKIDEIGDKIAEETENEE